MRPIEPGCKALVVHASRSGKIPIGTVVDVLRTCSCWSNKPEKGRCGGCGRSATTVWVVEVQHLGGAYCACECALMRIDPGEDDVDTFTIERWRDVAERHGYERAVRRIDEELERLRARHARILEREGSQ